MVPQAWMKETLVKAPAFYKDCSFKELWMHYPLTGDNAIVRRFLQWAIEKPNMEYARKPKHPSNQFVVKTWDNGCLNVNHDPAKLPLLKIHTHLKASLLANLKL